MLVKCGMIRAAKHIIAGIILGYQHVKHALHKVLWPTGWAGITLFAHAFRVIGAVWSCFSSCHSVHKSFLAMVRLHCPLPQILNQPCSPPCWSEIVVTPWRKFPQCMGLKDSSFLTDFCGAKFEVNALIVHLRWLNLFLSLAEECRREPEMSCQIQTNSIIL